MNAARMPQEVFEYRWRPPRDPWSQGTSCALCRPVDQAEAGEAATSPLGTPSFASFAATTKLQM
jgi:hypothetical protein